MEEFLIQGGREQQNLITCHPYASDGKHRKNTFHKPDAIAHLAFFIPIKEETISTGRKMICSALPGAAKKGLRIWSQDPEPGAGAVDLSRLSQFADFRRHGAALHSQIVRQRLPVIGDDEFAAAVLLCLLQ